MKGNSRDNRTGKSEQMFQSEKKMEGNTKMRENRNRLMIDEIKGKQKRRIVTKTGKKEGIDS